MCRMIMAADKVNAKVVVITGVGRGLGRAMVKEFAAQGHRVAGSSPQSCGCNSRQSQLRTRLRIRGNDARANQAIGSAARQDDGLRGKGKT